MRFFFKPLVRLHLLAFAGLCCIASLVIGCDADSEIDDTKLELVMPPGMIITAENENGGIQIEATERLARLFTWDENLAGEYVNLIPRTDRRNGTLGAYSQNAKWRKRKGISRGVFSEGQQLFSSEKEALQWLNFGWNKSGAKVVYSSSGLVIGYSKTMHREQINVDVWQIYINGKKPTSLRGASDDKIKVTYRNNNVPQKSVLKSNFIPNTPKVIDGTYYTGRALDLLSEHDKLTTKDIEYAIKNGTKSMIENNYKAYDFGESYNRIRIIIDQNDRVIFIYSSQR